MISIEWSNQNNIHWALRMSCANICGLFANSLLIKADYTPTYKAIQHTCIAGCVCDKAKAMPAFVADILWAMPG